MLNMEGFRRDSQIFQPNFCYYLSYVSSTSYKIYKLKSRRAVVSREAKKKQHARVFSGLRNHYSELFTWMEGLIFKMLYLSRYYNYRLVYYRPSTSYQRYCN